jgi:hypothetical protein
MSEENIGESLAGAENFRKIDDLSVLRGIIHQLRMSNEEYESENAELKNRLSVLQPRRSEGRGMSEMSKVEEVAQRMAAKELDDGDGLYDWYALTDSVADKYRAMARAAIEAMRKPTAAMTAVALQQVPNPEYDPIDQDCVNDWYRSVIDAALKE